ncbi:MAG TPA: hypothetical protein VIE43_27260 [Thermoanaerobaculia bacterium]|nr:hypothetical protein [Thermoanaerobaculia bacterium]
MNFSRPTLHPSFVQNESQRSFVRRQIQIRTALRAAPTERKVGAGESVAIPLTTVSEQGSFDAWIGVQFPTPGGGVTASLLVDSGSSTMIVPNGEDLVGVPGYTILGTAHEPWGCPANVVQGPLQIVARDGSVYEIQGCVFYACTGNNSAGERTANFGAGRILPWSANGWNTPPGLNVTMQSPLSYDTAHPYAELVYAPAGSLFSVSGEMVVNDESHLILHSSLPAGYTLLELIPDIEWMAVVPQALTIGGQLTEWPGNVPSPIAMVDTGGGPVFLSDPHGAVYATAWPDTVVCPTWAAGSQGCNCVSDPLTIGLVGSDGASSYSYTIDTASMPAPVQGLTAVMCEVNQYMMGQQGMNVGGITALFNRILICYQGAQVGFAPRLAS